MNVYDFDKTIYKGDSTKDFYLFCIIRNPLLLRYIFFQGFATFLYITKLIDKTKFKEKFYVFLKGIKDVEKELNIFWDKNENKIKKWYLENKEDGDIIISASPEFLLKGFCEKIGVKNLIASKVNKKNGKYMGKNCRGKEKVKRLEHEFKIDKIDKFYSDSYSDKPLADISNESFLVKGDKITVWK